MDESASHYLTCSSIWHLAKYLSSWVFMVESLSLGTMSSMDWRVREGGGEGGRGGGREGGREGG